MKISVCLLLLFELCSYETDKLRTIEELLSYNLVETQPNIQITQTTEDIGSAWKHGIIHDKEMVRAFYNILQAKNDRFVVFDVGAFTGRFSLLAKFFPNSHWYSFEPIQEAADCLRNNLILNEIANVSVIEMACSDSSEWRRLGMPSIEIWERSTFGRNILRFLPPIENRSVECIDIDTFVMMKEIRKVDFLNIDAEGWELFVLQGAKKLIQRDRPVIFMQYNEVNMRQCYIDSKEVELLLEAFGYQKEFINFEHVLCFPRTLHNP